MIIDGAQRLWTSTSSGGVPINVALASNGGIPTASSSLAAPRYVPEATNTGDRTGVGWGSSDPTIGGWNDETKGHFPDWLQNTFTASARIEEIDVITLQDNYGSPIEPTSELVFTLYGTTDFEVQYWDDPDWVTVTGGNVIGNYNVWRTFSFTPIVTDRVRVLVHDSADHDYSRIVELEAHGIFI